MYILCDPKKADHPSVQMQGSSCYVRWTLTIPAKSTAVLCHFQSQGSSDEPMKEVLKKWKSAKMLADLSPAMKKLIVNFSVPMLVDESLQIERSTLSDRVELDSGDVMLGKLENKEFAITTFYGQFTLPAQKVIGLANQGSREAGAYVLLADGQVLSGQLPRRTCNSRFPPAAR